jgi:hypothetical protein
MKITQKHERKLMPGFEFYNHHSPKNKQMKKTILIFGIISGLISTSLFIGKMLLGKAGHEDFKNGAIYGYTLMILAFSLIFVCTKIMRDKYNDGSISFGRAFLVGLYITLIASTVYVIVWLIDYHFFIPDFMEKYSAYVLEGLKASGANQTEITRQSAEMARLSEMYKNPLVIVLLTYAEILPVGLVVSLISALVLKRKRKEVASAAI